MLASHADPGFLPSRHGLRFPNRFPPGPTICIGPFDPRVLGIGDASMGLCGGFCLVTRRAFEGALPLPTTTAVPEHGSVLFGLLVREQLRSLRLGVVPWRFWRASLREPAQIERRSRDFEWPRIKATLDRDRLGMVGLIRSPARNPVRLIGNHQVLAYGYLVDADGVRLRVYDPNWPGRDDVTVPVDGGVQSTGEPLLGIVALD